MTASAAKSYLARLIAEHAGALLFVLGLLVAAGGATTAGVVLLVVGAGLFTASVVLGALSAVGVRAPGARMFGPGSIAAEVNRLTGWWYVEEAASVLGLPERTLRNWLRASVIATAVAFAAVPIVAIVRG